MGKLHIALIAGGWSGEREVSLKSGETVYRALDRNKYDVTWYDPRDDFLTLIKDREKIDLAFILLHGKFGEDGCIQGLLNILGISFVGSGVLPSALALHKKIAKKMYHDAGLSVAKDVIIHKGQNVSVEEILNILGPSTVVKPISEGSSLGTSICHSDRELKEGLDLAFTFDQEIMIEQYLHGREVTCCVLGNNVLETLPVVEIIPNPEYGFFNYKAKYTPGATREICPAPLPETLNERIQFCAKEAHQALKCRVWSRTDMIVQGDEVYILETNTIPGMTETSLVPLAARAAGMSLSQFLDKLIDLSFER